MAQSSYVIPNQSAAGQRADMNTNLQSVVSVNSGIAYPTTTYANMLVYRTDTDTLEKRNKANSAWITLGTVNETTSKFDPAYTYASSVEAAAGVDNTKVLTTLRATQVVSVLLGVLSPVAVTSITLSGLDLTTFREIHIVLNNLTLASSTFIKMNNLTITGSSVSGSDYFSGIGTIDLFSGVHSFNTRTSTVLTGSTIGTAYVGLSGITTASTAITFSTGTLNFTGGSFRVYGYR